MHKRLPLILSAAALMVALLGSTSLGQAAVKAAAKVVPKALYAKNAGHAVNASKLNGHKSSVSPTAGEIPVVGSGGQLPSSIIPASAPAPSAGVTGYQQIIQTPTVAGNASDAITDMSCPAGKVVIGGGFNGTGVSGINVMASHPMISNNTGWEFRAENAKATSAVVGYYIVCATGSA
jgi:hypothetical protein